MAHPSATKRKSNENTLNEFNDDVTPIPPDGGWGWIVVIASFLIHIITDGMTYSFGMLYSEFLTEFKEGKSFTSWILSILVGMTLCSGPISSSFVNRYGCRSVTIAGSILASGCLMISYYAQNVFTLILTIGFGTGFGLGLIYLPAIVSVTTYFEKYRSLATGIAVCGSGFGTFIFAPLLDHLIKSYEWRNTMLFLAGIVLFCAIFGAMFRPLESPIQERIIEELGTYQSNGNVRDIDNHRRSNSHLHGNKLWRTSKNGSAFRVPSVNVISEGNMNGGGIGGGETQLIRSHSVGHNLLSTKNPLASDGLLNATFDSMKNGKTNAGNIRSTLSQPLLMSSAEHEHKPLKGSQKFSRSGTLSRPDIFYQGSLCNIPHYRSHNELSTIVDRYGSLRRIDENECSDSQEYVCGCIPADAHETFATMMNFSLLKDLLFVLFILSNFCTSLGFNVPYVYLNDRAKDLGLTSEESSYLLAAIGIANTIGRIVLGYISDKPWVNRLWIYNICLISCGAATISSVYCETFYWLIAYSLIFGFTIGAYVGLTSVILVDLLGLEKLTNAFGLLLLFQGIASFVGPPIVGSLYDYTGSYTPGFAFAGGMILASGLMLFIIPTLQKYLKHGEHMAVPTNETHDYRISQIAQNEQNFQIS